MATTLYLRTLAFPSHATFTYLLSGRGATATTWQTTLTNGGNNIQWTKTLGGSVAEWISPRTPAGGFTLSGNITFNIWARESNLNDECTIAARVFRRTPEGVETEISGGPFSFVTELTASFAANNWTGTPSAGLAFAEDDRLVLRLYAMATTTMTAGNADISTNWSVADAQGDSFITLTETVAWKTETITRTIKTSGGDYSLVSSWESANQSDLVTDNVIAQAELYDGAYTDSTTVTGWTTGASNYIRIYTPVSQRHNGTSRSLSGRGAQITGVINPQEDYMYLEGLEIINAATSAMTISNLTTTTNLITIENVIAMVTGGASGGISVSDLDTNLIIRNSIVTCTTTADALNAADIASLVAQHNIFVCDVGRGLRWGPGAGDSHTVYNNYCYSGTIAALQRTVTGGTEIGGYNATDDATADDVLSTGALINIDPTNQFVNFSTNPSTANFHLKNGSSLINAGTPIVAVTTDIDGQARDSVTPDIGADEFYSSAYTRILPIVNPTFSIVHGIDVDIPPVGKRRN